MNKNKTAVAVVANFKFLYKYFDSFLMGLKNNGKYYGDVVVVTSLFTPTFLIKTFKKKKLKIHVIRFKKIRFNKKTRNRYLSLNNNNQPNRFKYKNFQWFKLTYFIKIKSGKNIFRY